MIVTNNPELWNDISELNWLNDLYYLFCTFNFITLYILKKYCILPKVHIHQKGIKHGAITFTLYIYPYASMTHIS